MAKRSSALRNLVPPSGDAWVLAKATAEAIALRCPFDPEERNKLMGEAQKLVARDAVAAYLVQPTWITVANARVKGLWKDMPLFVNDVAAMSWQ